MTAPRQRLSGEDQAARPDKATARAVLATARRVLQAERQRIYRERSEAGRRVFRFEADAVDVEELLVADGCLHHQARDNPEAVRKALGEWIGRVLAERRDAAERA